MRASGSLALDLAGHLSGSRATAALCLPGPCSITCGALPGRPGPLSLGVGPRGHSPASPRGLAPWSTHRPQSGHALCLGVQQAPLGGQVAEVLPRESGLGCCHPRAQRQQSWGTSTDPACPPTRRSPWSPSASLSRPRNGNGDDGASRGCRQRTCSGLQPGSQGPAGPVYPPAGVGVAWAGRQLWEGSVRVTGPPHRAVCKEPPPLGCSPQPRGQRGQRAGRGVSVLGG